MRRLFHSTVIVGTLAVASTISGLAHAQSEPEPTGAPEPPAKAPPSPKERARLHFTAGVNLLRDPGHPRYDEAYVEFKRAYALVPSYKILGNIALCAMKLERDAEAIDAYTRYLDEAPDLEPEEREQAERDLVTLKAGLARVRVESRPDGAVVHDTRVPAQGPPITNVYGPLHGSTELGLRRGHHVLKARFKDGSERVWELDVNGDESHLFEKPETEPVATPTVVPSGPVFVTVRERPITRLTYAAGLGTVALGLGSLVTGALAVDAHARFASANDGANPDRANDIRSTGQTLNVVSDVLLVSALAGAAFTSYLYLTRPTTERAVRAGGLLFVGPTGVAGSF